MTLPLHDKTILITGVSDGIGRAAALQLAAQGAAIVGVGRTPEKLAATAAALAEVPNGGRFELLRADLSSMAAVRTLAAEIDQRFPRIDVLLNNAGGIFYAKTVTDEGFETTFALDHLSPFLLTNLLLDKLAASQARVITVSSMAHMMGTIDFDDLDFARRKYSAWGAYAQAKLANVLFANELSRRTAGTGMTSNSLHPGFVRTSFGGGQPSLLARSVTWAAQWMGVPAAQGAATSVYLASSPEVAQVSGAYFADCRQASPKREALDPAVAARLWQRSAELVQLEDCELLHNLYS